VCVGGTLGVCFCWRSFEGWVSPLGDGLRLRRSVLQVFIATQLLQLQLLVHTVYSMAIMLWHNGYETNLHRVLLLFLLLFTTTPVHIHQMTSKTANNGICLCKHFQQTPIIWQFNSTMHAGALPCPEGDTTHTLQYCMHSCHVGT